MGKKSLRYAVGALCLALAAAVATVPLDTAAAAGISTPVNETSWTHAMSQLPEMTKVVHARHVIALADAKTALQADVRTADALFESSKGKATDESRKQLAVERNRASALVMVSDDEAAPAVAQERLAAVADKVTTEVAAWEAAEAARIAEEARVAAEAAAAAQAAAARHPGGRKGSSGTPAAGQTPQQYLEGIAGSYGGSISWTATPCGRAAAGCYQGGSTLYISTSLYGSWSTAQGRGRNVVIHEASHMIIQWKCGTVLLGGARFENVTDAYAVLLGASSGTGYGYNDNDMALAKAALGGQCLEG
ncbi:MAG: hypothetical protein HGA51_01125 [Demequinaceae bacterium]|nr:hypothetical protein [Demequinaceae bacterium]